jgi:hypothetical protein
MLHLLPSPTLRRALAGLALLGLLGGCDDDPAGGRRDGPAPDGPPEPSSFDARHDGSFVGRDLGSTGPGRWPTAPIPAPWTVTRIPAALPPPPPDAPVDAAAPAEPDAAPDGPEDQAIDQPDDQAPDQAADDAPDAGVDGAADPTADPSLDAAPDREPDGVPDLAMEPPPILNAVGARAEGDSFALTTDGTGLPITGARDDFLFVHRPLAGDGAILALARATSGCSQARIEFGVMLRSSTSDDASYGMAAVTGPAGGATLMSRASAGWFSNVLRFDSSPPLPVWLKVERHGNRLRIGYSRDGRAWTEAERDLFDAPLVLQAGLVAASHGGTCTVLFERVALLGASAQAP